MPRDLTDVQNATLRAIAQWVELHGYPPTRDELADVLSIAPSSLEDRLDALEDKGYIRRTPGRARAIKIVDDETRGD